MKNKIASEKSIEENLSVLLQENKDLHHKNEFIETIIDNLADLIAVFDTDTRFILFNKKCEEVYNLKKEEVLGKNFLEVFPNLLNADTYTSVLYALKGESLSNHSFYSNIANRYFTTTIIPLKNKHGSIYSAVVMAHDNTDILNNANKLKKLNEKLHQKNKALQHSEAWSNKMVESIDDYAILLLDKNGIIQNWNKGAEKIKGYKPEEIIGKKISIFYTKKDRDNNLPGKLLKEAEIKGKASHEGWRVRSNNTKFWGSVIITALYDANENLIGFTKTTRDLTERKLYEDRQKEYAEKLEEKNKDLLRINNELISFTYVASHDLQEPLRKIQTFSDRVLQKNELISDETKDYFLRIRRAAERMQALIDDLLAYSRLNISEKKFIKTDLNLMIEDIKNELKDVIDEKQAIFEIKKLPSIKVIPFQFHQLFTNLMTNALKFSKPGSPPCIRIESEIIKNEDSPYKSDSNKNFYHIKFIDNGIGFEPEYNDKIFEVFKRLHGRAEYPGTGVGLAICKKIVENHDGYITADSKPSHETVFNIYLPK